jgi:DNA-binding transcriptional LysR family regulator
MTTPAQALAIRDGHVDLGVCHASAMSAEEQRGVARTRLTIDYVNCALVAESSELAFRERLSFEDLRGIPFLFPPRAFLPGMYDDLFAVFEASGFEPRVDATYDGLQTIWALIAENRGWGIGFASQCALPPAGTRAVPIEHFSLPWGLDLLTREDESRALILQVASMLRRIARDEG